MRWLRTTLNPCRDGRRRRNERAGRPEHFSNLAGLPDSGAERPQYADTSRARSLFRRPLLARHIGVAGAISCLDLACARPNPDRRASGYELTWSRPLALGRCDERGKLDYGRQWQHLPALHPAAIKQKFGVDVSALNQLSPNGPF